MNDRNERTTHLLVLAALLVVAACSKPSDRYQGISEPREITSERSPATRPSLPSPASGQGTGSAVRVSPTSDDTDSHGTTNPLPIAAENPYKTANGGRDESTAKRQGRTARARFEPAPGMKVEGSARLEEVEAGVHITVDVERHLRPGAHGLHIHERPDCSDIPGKSMGAHFAPDGRQHGLPGFAEHHLGDLGNLTIHGDGGGELEITVPRETLKEGGELSLVGRALVIHQKRDEGRRSQPSGDSGPPVACAVIEAS